MSLVSQIDILRIGPSLTLTLLVLTSLTHMIPYAHLLSSHMAWARCHSSFTQSHDAGLWGGGVLHRHCIVHLASSARASRHAGKKDGPVSKTHADAIVKNVKQSLSGFAGDLRHGAYYTYVGPLRSLP